jgi:hypothetical protein
MTQTVADILRAARGKIERPENWTRDAEARNYYGDRVDRYDPDAVCWCLLGALGSVSPFEVEIRWSAEDVLERVIDDNVPDFNDSHTHAEVLDALDEAIVLAESANV